MWISDPGHPISMWISPISHLDVTWQGVHSVNSGSEHPTGCGRRWEMPQLTPVFGLKLSQALSSLLVVQTHPTQLAPKVCKGTYVPSVINRDMGISRRQTCPLKPTLRLLWGFCEEPSRCLGITRFKLKAHSTCNVWTLHILKQIK